MRSDILALIDPARIVHNYRALRARCRPGVMFCAPLKADAYGHGIAQVAPALQEAGADWAAVATIPEAVALRGVGWRRPILVFSNALAVADGTERSERLAAIRTHGLTQTVCDLQTIRWLASQPLTPPIDVHLKFDTGMGRMGALPGDADALLDAIASAKSIRPTGVYSHFATADWSLPKLVDRQLDAFRALEARVARRFGPSLIRHMANSAATIDRPDAHFDLVRPGLALYGYWPCAAMKSLIDLRPALRLVSHVSLIKELPAQHCVGYGGKWITEMPTRLGIVPVGYADGLIRRISPDPINGRPRPLEELAVAGTPAGDAPIIGRISMDQLAIDLTALPSVALGDEVVLIDENPDRPNSVAAIARRLGTIEYEVTCLLGGRIEHLTLDDRAERPRSQLP